MTIFLTDAERETIAALAEAAEVEPGTRCPCCNRRVNRKLKDDSPAPKEARFRGPEDIVESVHEKVDTLQEWSGADPYSYPAIKIVDAALNVAIQQREEFRNFFRGES
jgi:hypothetical protein